MKTGKCCLSWNNYTDHFRAMMKEQMMNDHFSDVTLISEDKKCFNAHRNVLSACSPFFKDIFQTEHSSIKQIIFLRGIYYSDLESVMQFIYLGEATFYKERMNEFLAVARSLEIKDLDNDGYDTKVVQGPEQKLISADPSIEKFNKESGSNDAPKLKTLTGTLEMEEKSVQKNEPLEYYERIEELKEESTQSDSNDVPELEPELKKHFETIEELKKESIQSECNDAPDLRPFVGTLELKEKSVQNDVEMNQEPKKITTRGEEVIHNRKKECDPVKSNKCEFNAADKETLKRHNKSIHHEYVYHCNHCDYSTLNKNTLKHHKKRTCKGLKLERSYYNY